MTPNLTRPSVEQQLSDYQVPEPVCATVRALLAKVEAVGPKYSGPASRPFWRRVKRLGDSNAAVYALGCALQDLENRVLIHLRNDEVAKEQP